MTATSQDTAGPNAAERTAVRVLVTLSFCHLLNDMMQTLLLGIYPLLKTTLALDFGQIGLITLTFQMTASILQPLVGIYTDRRPQPFALAIGMGCTLAGLLMLPLSAGNQQVEQDRAPSILLHHEELAGQTAGEP